MNTKVNAESLAIDAAEFLAFKHAMGMSYLRRRDEVLAASGLGASPALFVRRDGSALTLRAASEVLRRLLRDLGLKPPRGRVGARPYEFRHAFAVHRLPEPALRSCRLYTGCHRARRQVSSRLILGCTRDPSFDSALTA